MNDVEAIIDGLVAVCAYPGLHAAGLDELRDNLSRAITALRREAADAAQYRTALRDIQEWGVIHVKHHGSPCYPLAVANAALGEGVAGSAGGDHE